MWWGVLGLALSPARGFVWYNPPAFLALVSWPRFHSARRSLSNTVLALIAAHLLVFGAWWQWWGGYGWGPRFLLPLAPVVVLASLPVVERGSRALVAAALLAGILIQVAGTLVNFNQYELELEAGHPAPADRPLLYHHDPALVYDVRRSTIVVHLRRIFAARPDLAWWPGAAADPTVPAILNALATGQRSGDAIIYLVPELLDALATTPSLPPALGLPVNVPPTDPVAARLFARATRDAQRVWLITWYGAGDEADWYKEELRWRAQVTPAQNFVTFVHLLGADGALIAGQDRQPLGGYRPTSTWTPGEAIADRFAFTATSQQLRSCKNITSGFL